MGPRVFQVLRIPKKVNLLTDHQTLQPLLKRNRDPKQYSARLTRWLDRLSHFDVIVQYTAGNNIQFTERKRKHHAKMKKERPKRNS